VRAGSTAPTPVGRPPIVTLARRGCISLNVVKPEPVPQLFVKRLPAPFPQRAVKPTFPPTRDR
jgi:hypothetical protein